MGKSGTNKAAAWGFDELVEIPYVHILILGTSCKSLSNPNVNKMDIDDATRPNESRDTWIGVSLIRLRLNTYLFTR